MRMPFIQNKLAIIHTALPPLSFKPRPDARAGLFQSAAVDAHERDLWLVTTAELTANKNLFTAIDAVASYNQTAKQKIFYTIIGGGEQKAELHAHIIKLGLEQQIVLLGFVENAWEYLKACDVFLLPSKKEGLPYALLEAAAAGLPLIASRVGGIPEVVTDGVEGLLIDPTSLPSFIEAFSRVAHEEQRQQFTNAALSKSTQFNLTDMVAKTRAVYEAK